MKLMVVPMCGVSSAMSRERWAVIKQAKNFYVATFRRIGNILFISMFLSLCFSLIICYVYLHQPESKIYASSGVVPPVRLTPMDHRNETSVPLLASYSDTDEGVLRKVIPD